MNTVSKLEPWVLTIEPGEGESISSFLGRFRRANGITVSLLGSQTGLGATNGRWEKLRFNPWPSPAELTRLAALVEVDPNRLLALFPTAKVQLDTVRLCAVCYREAPYHQWEWQVQGLASCKHHHLTLLSECPQCGTRFKRPSLWEGHCHRCFTPFASMSSYQKALP
jgi:hypothetical protein